MIEACLYVPEEGRCLQEFSMRGLLRHVVVVVMYFQSVLHMIGPVLMSDFSYASQLFVFFCFWTVVIWLGPCWWDLKQLIFLEIFLLGDLIGTQVCRLFFPPKKSRPNAILKPSKWLQKSSPKNPRVQFLSGAICCFIASTCSNGYLYGGFLGKFFGSGKLWSWWENPR